MIQLVMTYMSTIGFNINNIHRNRLNINVTEAADRDSDTIITIVNVMKC